MAYNSSGNIIQRTTPVVLNLIIINVLVYIAQVAIPFFNVTEWGALHYFTSPLFKPHQLVTNMFMHDPSSFNHILFNMFGLWMFGTVLERFLGSKRFLIFYLICGIGASLVIEMFVPYSASQVVKSVQAANAGLSANDIIIAYKQQYSALGASGAIMGVMAAFAYLFPNTEMYIMFIPLPVKAKYVIPGYVLFDLFGGIHPSSGDNVGHFAHLGGALIGFILILIWNKTNKKTFY